MKDYNFYVYILTNWNNEVMYIGMTNNLERRLYEHKNKLVDGFTRKYNVNKLVYYLYGNDVNAAIAREKEIKKWRREKKNNLVVTMNPTWKDLSLEWEADKVSRAGRNDNPVTPDIPKKRLRNLSRQARFLPSVETTKQRPARQGRSMGWFFVIDMRNEARVRML